MILAIISNTIKVVKKVIFNIVIGSDFSNSFNNYKYSSSDFVFCIVYKFIF